MSDVTDTPQLAAFHAMTEGTQDDWNIIATEAIHNFVGLPERLMAHMRLLGGDFGGFAVDRLEHSLQTATRAERDNRDDEYVLCALLHDIGDILGPANHADIGATILHPFISDQNHWMLQKHGIFQGYYFFNFLGADPNMRDEYLGHEWFDYTAEFCHNYDQVAFDPSYVSNPLEHYEPLLRDQLMTAKRSIYRKAMDEAEAFNA